MTEDEGSAAFRGRVVAVPETRQLDVLANLLGRRGALVLRCPLVAIKDSPDADAVTDWLSRAVEQPPDLLVFYTGEGIERLLGFAERAGLRTAFLEVLAGTRKLCRGPKPKRALRRLELEPELEAAAPTTQGIIETLNTLDLRGQRVGVQLYAEAHVPELERTLAALGAEADWVTPYIYSTEADDARVVELIEALDAGEVDAIAFTSQSQVARLFKLAERHAMLDRLASGLRQTCIAAVGPVVAKALGDAGVRVDTVPEEQFFMKPLVTALESALEATPPK